jgi:hypothetical protein
LALVTSAPAKTGLKLGDVSDGSRAVSIHRINLYNEQGHEEEDRIFPDDDPLLPFSTRQTCGFCHSYDIIGTGWHFNAADPNITPGRPGQPWLLVNARTATQIPLSYRPWPGTFKPQQLGLTHWKFIQYFGRHLPGGGVGELDSDDPAEILRQDVSGKLEINCLACHNADPAHDQAESTLQIARQNLRWATAATCAFASVSGSARDMSDTYDPFMPEPPLDPKKIPPTITYGKNTFDDKNKVFFDIVRKVPDQRCYFCHSNVDVDNHGSHKWLTDEDVHLAAGLTCVDCHRNGLAHNIIRGYENSDSTNPLAATSSCKGCHTTGRLGAPVPKHPGIPLVHFDKLTCTACHSSPWPEQKTLRTKTSRAHALGTLAARKSPDALPHIVYPVLARQHNDKIAPHKLLWPAYWGLLKAETVTPLDLEAVRQTAGKIIARQRPPRSGDWLPITENQISEVLKSLSSQKSAEGEPIYISGGKLYRLNEKGQLLRAEHVAAQPYLWPIAHNVRPAAQSLGVGHCQDCHSTDAPFFFGQVAIDSPLVSQKGATRKMVEFQHLDARFVKLFAMSFVFRPWLKVVALASCAVLAAVLLLYALKALACITKAMAGKED